MKNIIRAYRNHSIIIAAAISLIGAAFAVDGRYAKASIEERVINIERVVCLSAIKNKVGDAKEICSGVLTR